MATLKDLTDLMASSNFTEAQIADLISTLTVMQKENKVSKRGKKVVLSAELLELLEKCTLNRGAALSCPKCGSVSVSKNGKRNGRQRYLCKDCHRTFGDTYGTLLSSGFNGYWLD